MVVVENNFGIFDYIIEGEHEEEAAEYMRERLDYLMYIPYIPHLGDDLAGIRRTVAELWGVKVWMG